MNEQEHKAFILGLPDRGISGGTVYDALVAATAASCNTDLITCDRRALPIYDRYGLRVQSLGS